MPGKPSQTGIKDGSIFTFDKTNTPSDMGAGDIETRAQRIRKNLSCLVFLFGIGW
jgi:hypothetical protein